MPIKPEEYIANIENLLKEFGLENVSEGDQMQFMSRLGQNIFNRILIEVAKKLPIEKLNEFETLTKGGDAEAIRAFLEREIPDFAVMVQTESKNEIEDTKKLMGSV